MTASVRLMATSGPAGPPARREQILAAAARLFRAQGYHGTSIDELGQAVGISGPALYRHFPGKQALLAALVERGLLSLAVSLETRRGAVAGGAPADAAEVLAGAVRELVERARRNRDLATVVLREARHLGPALVGPVAQARRRLDQALVTLVQAARPEMPADEAKLLVAAVYGLLGPGFADDGEVPEVELEELLASTAMTCLLSGGGPRR